MAVTAVTEGQQRLTRQGSDPNRPGHSVTSVGRETSSNDSGNGISSEPDEKIRQRGSAAKRRGSTPKAQRVNCEGLREFTEFTCNKNVELTILDGYAKVQSPEPFTFSARVATQEDFYEVYSHLRSEKKVLLGPLLELNTDQDLPKGFRFSIRHCLVPNEGKDSKEDLHHFVRVVKSDDGYKSEDIQSFSSVKGQYFGTDKLRNFCFLTVTGDVSCEHVKELNICITRKKTQECPGSHQADVYGVSGPMMGQFKAEFKENNNELAMDPFPIFLCKGFAYTMYLHTDEGGEGKQIGREGGLRHDDVWDHFKVPLGDIDAFPCKKTKHLKLRLTHEQINDMDTAVHSKIPREYFGKNGSNLAGKLNNCQKFIDKAKPAETATSFPKHNWEIVKDHRFSVPGVAATVDNQENTSLCTSYAMAKAVVDALDQGKWTNGEEYDAVQHKMVEEKMNHIWSDKDEGIWPEEFRGKSITIDAKKKGEDTKTLKITFDTQTCKPTKENFMSGNDSIPILAVVVVWSSITFKKKSKDARHTLHSVYAKNYKRKTDTFDCINSWGEKDYATPQIAASEVFLLELISATVEFVDKSKSDVNA